MRRLMILAVLPAMTGFVCATETQPEACDAVLKTSISAGSVLMANSADYWTPSGVPEAGKLYYVPSGLTLSWKKEDGKEEFPGKVALAGGFVSPRNGTINWSELRLLSGSKYSWSSMSQIGGTLIVEAEDAAHPAEICIFHPNGYGSLSLYADFSSAPNAHLKLSRSGKPYNDPVKGQVGNPDCPWYARGSWDQFYGTCYVANESLYQPIPSSGAFFLPGKLVIQNNAWYLGTSVFKGTATFGSLVLEDGSHFWPRCDQNGDVSETVVTEKLTVGEVELDFVLSVGATSASDNTLLKTRCALPAYTPGSPVKVPIFKLTGAAAQTENLPDFSRMSIPDYPEGQRLAGLYPARKAIVVEDDADGAKIVYAKYYDEDTVWKQIRASGSYQPKDCPYNPDSAAGVAAYWDPAEIPAEDDEGIVWLKYSTMFNPNYPHSFPKLTFIAEDGAGIYMHGGDTRMKQFVLRGASQLMSYSGARTNRLDAPVYVEKASGLLSAQPFQGYYLELLGPISGPGSFRYVGVVPHTSPKAFCALLGDNTGLQGRFYIDSKTIPEETYDATGKRTSVKFPDLANDMYQTLIITNGNALGGEYAGTDAWKAFELNNYAKLQVNETTAFAEPTRGLYIKWGAQIEVPEGKTFTLGVPVTFAGELQKRGAGILAFGGASAAFVTGAGTTPLAGTNVVSVLAGWIMPKAAHALDGCAISFAEGTGLTLEAEPVGEDLRDLGLCNVKWATPFMLPADDRLSVSVEGDPTVGAPLAICTVTAVAETALGLSAKTFRVARKAHLRAKVARVVNADDSVTYKVTFSPDGLALSFR